MPAYLPILLIALHGLAAAIWVGGMFMAYVAVRPAAARVLDVPERTILWQESFAGVNRHSTLTPYRRPRLTPL